MKENKKKSSQYVMQQCIFEQRIFIRQSSIGPLKIFVFQNEISFSLLLPQNSCPTTPLDNFPLL